MYWHGIDLHWAYADLLGGIRRRTGCTHRAYDVLHASLVRLALVSQQRPIAEPNLYLRTIVKHEIVDQFHDHARWVELPDAEDDDAFAASHSLTPEHLADLQQRLRATQRILDCLPARSREVFWQFRIEGHTYKEIAARSSMTARTVERLIMRALLDISAARDELMT
jgi:RNA polymerase sigma factor (sigma-70 family)